MTRDEAIDILVGQEMRQLTPEERECIALKRRLAGVLNSYLAIRLREVGINTDVSGLEQSLFACPCCRYQSLDRRGEYDICHVCFWEDDGTEDEGGYSSPNHMTLREARENFVRIGAVTPEMRQHVLADGPERYRRE